MAVVDNGYMAGILHKRYNKCGLLSRANPAAAREDVDGYMDVKLHGDDFSMRALTGPVRDWLDGPAYPNLLCVQ
jgi:hypothetical protein